MTKKIGTLLILFLFIPACQGIEATPTKRETFKKAIKEAFSKEKDPPRIEYPFRLNTVPHISRISDLEITGAKTVEINFMISDGETGANILDVSVYTDNDTLIPPESLKSRGHGSQRQLIFKTAPEHSGVANFKVLVSDGTYQSMKAFTVSVLKQLKAKQSFQPNKAGALLKAIFTQQNPPSIKGKSSTNVDRMGDQLTISNIPDQEISAKQTTLKLKFTINPFSPTFDVRARSNNLNLVKNMEVRGLNQHKTLIIMTNPHQSGEAIITVVVKNLNETGWISFKLRKKA